MKKYFFTLFLSLCIRFSFGQLGDIDTSFHIGTGFQATITATAIQPDNKIIAGGNFTSFNGTNYRTLVRLFPDGRIDSNFYIGSSGFNSPIKSIKILPDSTMLVAGEFTYLNGANLNTTIVKLTKNGTIDPSFYASTNINGGITAMEVDTTTGKIYIVGLFTSVCGQPRKHIACLMSNGTIDSTFDVGAGFTGTFGQSPPYCMKLLANGDLLVGGNFIFYKGMLASKFCKITPSGNIDTAFATNISSGGGFNGNVLAIELLNNGKIIVGGSFSNALSENYNNLVCLNSDGTINISFNISDGISGEVYAIKVTPENKILVGGSFNFFNNISESSIIQLNIDGTKDANFVNGCGLFSTGFSAKVYCFAIQSDSNIIVGGEFNKYKDSIANNIIRIIGKGSSVLSTPTLTTATPSIITNKSARLGGEVTDNGNSSILSQGVCWSTSPNPSILNDFVSATNTPGAYNVSVSSFSDSTIYYVKAYATNSEGTAYGDQMTFTTRSASNYSCGDVTFNYNGASVTYGTIKGKYGRCWLDRNLGANHVPEDIYDNQANGDLFQWGRLADGHQIRTSDTTDVLSLTATPSTNSFIVTSVTPFDWMNTPNNNLWNGINAVNNPCPSGWRLPTESEFNEEMTTWSAATPAGAFESALRLHEGGVRSYLAGGIVNVGTMGAYWTSNASSPYAKALMVEAPTVQLANSYRSMGASVRCIKDYTNAIQIIDVNKAFQIFPNPANNQLSIQLTDETNANSELYIYDNTGRLIVSQHLSNKIEQIDIRQLPVGIYFVKIQSKNTQQIEKLAIVR